MPIINNGFYSRFLRNIKLNEVGAAGQKKLNSSSVVVLGCGGLGSAAAYYLCGAGVGRIGLADNGKIEESNLQRQILYSSKDIGKFKVEQAERRLKSLWPAVKIDSYKEKIALSNIKEIIKGYDFVIDAVDNFETKFLINDYCVKLGKAFVHCGVQEWGGQLLTVLPSKTACYRCFFGSPDIMELENPCDFGIIGMAAGVFGSIQASEAVKCIMGIGKPLYNRLLKIDLLNNTFRLYDIKKNTSCPVCSL